MLRTVRILPLSRVMLLLLLSIACKFGFISYRVIDDYVTQVVLALMYNMYRDIFCP